METLQDYLDTMPSLDVKERVKEVLDWVQKTFPQLESRIAWKQPMFTDHGTFIIGFSVAKHHMAIAPEEKSMDLFYDRLKAVGYNPTSKMFRIKWESEVDYDLLYEIIQYNIEDKKDCETFWRK